MNRTWIKTTLAVLILGLALLGFLQPVIAVGCDIIVDTDPMNQYDDNTARAYPREQAGNILDEYNIEWYDYLAPPHAGNPIRTDLNDGTLSCADDVECANDTTVGEIVSSGTHIVRVYCEIDNIEWASGSDVFEVNAVPDFPLGLLPLAALVVVIALYTKREMLSSRLS